jgi:hypothetical protein
VSGAKKRNSMKKERFEDQKERRIKDERQINSTENHALRGSKARMTTGKKRYLARLGKKINGNKMKMENNKNNKSRHALHKTVKITVGKKRNLLNQTKNTREEKSVAKRTHQRRILSKFIKRHRDKHIQHHKHFNTKNTRAGFKQV